MLSGALRHQSSWQISLPFGLVSQTLHPQPLHVPCFFFVFLQWSVKWRPLSAGGLLLWTVKRTKKISPGDAGSCYGSMFVYLKVGAQAMPRNRYYILTMFYFKNILSNDNSTPQCKTPKKYRGDADSWKNVTAGWHSSRKIWNKEQRMKKQTKKMTQTTQILGKTHCCIVVCLW